MAEVEGKSAAILCVLQVLQKYATREQPLTNRQVLAHLEREYAITLTPNTLRAHLARLTLMGYPVSTYEQNRKGVFLDEPEPERTYDDEEVRVLIDSVLTSRYIPAHQAQALIEKLTKLAGPDFPMQLAYVRPLHEWNHRRNKSFFWNLSCLAEAVASGKQAEFYYNTVAPDGSLVRKGGLARVHPYTVVCTNGQYYLVCSLGRYDNLLHYRIDRMTEVKLREKPARRIETIPGYENGLNLARYASEHPFMYGGKSVSVVLKMPVERAGDVLDNFGDRAVMRDLGDGTMEVRLTAAEEGIRYFALQFGSGGCEVLSPPSLRNRLREDVQRLAEQYR